MPEENTSKEQKKTHSEALNEPKDIGNCNNDEKQEIFDKSEDLIEIHLKSLTPNNSLIVPECPTAADIEIQKRELYQINNFIR